MVLTLRFTMKLFMVYGNGFDEPPTDSYAVTDDQVEPSTPIGNCTPVNGFDPSIPVNDCTPLPNGFDPSIPDCGFTPINSADSSNENIRSLSASSKSSATTSDGTNTEMSRSISPTELNEGESMLEASKSGKRKLESVSPEDVLEEGVAIGSERGLIRSAKRVRFQLPDDQHNVSKSGKGKGKKELKGQLYKTIAQSKRMRDFIGHDLSKRKIDFSTTSEEGSESELEDGEIRETGESGLNKGKNEEPPMPSCMLLGSPIALRGEPKMCEVVEAQVPTAEFEGMSTSPECSESELEEGEIREPPMSGAQMRERSMLLD